MALHSTHMKRIVAKEFLLFVGCGIAVLLVLLFVWGRNAFLIHKLAKLERALSVEADSLFNLNLQASPRRLDFLDLFDPKYVRSNYDVFLRTPRWTKSQFFDVHKNDPFSEFGGEQVFDSGFHRRYLICTANALKESGYLTPNRLSKLSELAGLVWRPATERPMPWEEAAWYKYNDLLYQFDSGIFDDTDVLYNALVKMRISPQVLSENLPPDTSNSSPTMLIAFALERDTLPFAELRSAFEHLEGNHILICSFDEFLFTLQRKPLPPAQEVVDELAAQSLTVSELRKEANDARASLWSDDKQWTVVKWAAIVLLVLVYPVRLLVLGTRWAIRILRH